MQSPNDPLDPLLERWRNEATPHFEPLAPEVWRRIADADTPSATISFWTKFELVVSRPSFAAAFVAACVLCGLFLAEARLSRLQADRSARLEKSYVQLIDPLLQYAALPKKQATTP